MALLGRAFVSCISEGLNAQVPRIKTSNPGSSACPPQFPFLLPGARFLLHGDGTPAENKEQESHRITLQERGGKCELPQAIAPGVTHR